MRAKGGQGQNRDWSGSGWQERKGKGDWKENDRSEKREESRQDRTGERKGEKRWGEKSGACEKNPVFCSKSTLISIVATVKKIRECLKYRRYICIQRTGNKSSRAVPPGPIFLQGPPAPRWRRHWT